MDNIYSLNDISATLPIRYETGIRGLDFLLNGGLVKGSTVLASGTTGAGKSTLFLQIADYMANISHQKVLYIAGEENKEQVKMRANRMLVNSDFIFLSEDPEVEKISNAIYTYMPSLVIIDSLQMVYSPTIKQHPMTPTQMKNGLLTLTKLTRLLDTTIVFIGHATKGGFIAGLQTLQHMVDTVMYVGIDDDTNSRFVEVKKNRFGESGNKWQFIMMENGIHDDPRNYTLNHSAQTDRLTEEKLKEVQNKYPLRGLMAKVSLNWLRKHSIANFTSLSTSENEELFKNHPVWKPFVTYSLNWLQKEVIKL